MKMAVVGCEASGKTVFMAALADYYGRSDRGKDGLRLIPENAAANSFAQYQYRQLRCLRQWPPATNPGRTIEIKWTLRRDGTALVSIDMLEFGGETFRAAFREDTTPEKQDQSVHELKTYLGDADFVVVLVSLKDLFRDPGSLSMEEFERQTESLWVTRGLLEFVRTTRPDAGLVIGLTQADRYRDVLAEEGGGAALFAARWPTVREAAPDVPIVEVASVSKTDEHGNPAENYKTHGILPVMQELGRQCFGDAKALETGTGLKNHVGKSKPRPRIAFWVALVSLSVVAAGLCFHYKDQPIFKLPAFSSPIASQTPVVSNVVTAAAMTNKTTSTTITNCISTAPVFIQAATNTAPSAAQSVATNTNVTANRPVVTTISNITSKASVLAAPTNRSDTARRQQPVSATNVVQETIQPKVAQAAKTIPPDKPQKSDVVIKISKQEKPKPPAIPAGYRIWKDHKGEPIAAKWTDCASNGKSITILTLSGRKINAQISKFSPSDQAYIAAEIKKHQQLGEARINGKWEKVSVKPPSQETKRQEDRPRRSYREEPMPPELAYFMELNHPVSNRTTSVSSQASPKN